MKVQKIKVSLAAVAFATAAFFFPISTALCANKEVAKTILFLGDSLTEGLNLPKEAAYPDVVGRMFEKNGFKNIKIINAGVSGSTSASGPSRLRWHLRSKEKADILLLALGANDGLRGLDTKAMKNNLLQTIAIAKKENMTIVVAGMKIPPNYGKDYADRFEKTFDEVATKEGVAYIPFLLDGVGGEPKYNLADGIHPNEAGAKIIGEMIYKHLESLL